MGNFSCKKKKYSMKKPTEPKITINDYFRMVYNKNIASIENIKKLDTFIIRINDTFYCYNNELFFNKITFSNFSNKNISLTNTFKEWEKLKSITNIQIPKLHKDYIYQDYFKKTKKDLFNLIDLNFENILDFFKDCLETDEDKIFDIHSNIYNLKDKTPTIITYNKLWTVKISSLKQIIGSPIMTDSYLNNLFNKNINLSDIYLIIGYKLLFYENLNYTRLFEYLKLSKIENLNKFTYFNKSSYNILDHIELKDFFGYQQIIQELKSLKMKFNNKFFTIFDNYYKNQTELLFILILFLKNTEENYNRLFDLNVNNLYLYYLKNTNHICTCIELYEDLLKYNKYYNFEETKEYNENVYYCLIEEKINKFHENIMNSHLQYGHYDFCIQWNFKFNNKSYKTKNFDEKIVDCDNNDIELFKNIISFYTLNDFKDIDKMYYPIYNYRHKFTFTKYKIYSEKINNLVNNTFIKKDLNSKYQSIQYICSTIPTKYNQYITKIKDIEQSKNKSNVIRNNKFNRGRHINTLTFGTSTSSVIKDNDNNNLNERLNKEQDTFLTNTWVNSLPSNSKYNY